VTDCARDESRQRPRAGFLLIVIITATTLLIAHGVTLRFQFRFIAA